MPKQLMVKDDVVAVLDRIKDETNSKSYSDVINRMARVYKEHDPGQTEIVHAFEELKQRLTSVVLDGTYVTMCDFMKIIALNIARHEPERRVRLINEVHKLLETAISKTSYKNKNQKRLNIK